MAGEDGEEGEGDSMVKTIQYLISLYLSLLIVCVCVMLPSVQTKWFVSFRLHWVLPSMCYFFSISLPFSVRSMLPPYKVA